MTKESSRHAAALGRLAAGRPKKLTQEVREAKRKRMQEINKRRADMERRFIAAKNLAGDAIDLIAITIGIDRADPLRKRLEQL